MEYKYMPVDKLLRNTRMYPGCVSASESAAELGRRLADAQATVEALQRERDFFETAAAAANRMRVDTERALDAEREKVKEPQNENDDRQS